MTNYRRIKFCDFEITWEISNKAKYKHHKGHHTTSHFYSKSSRQDPLVINKRPNSKPIIYQAFSSVAFSSEEKDDKDKLLCTNFDTDSFLIGVDNRTSFSMSSNPEDFVTPITPVNNLYVQGIGGRLKVIGKGTVS